MTRDPHSYLVPTFKQFFNLTLGQRGQGKSVLQEKCLEVLYDARWTCIDLWSAGNLESLFYCVNLDCKKKHKDLINEIEHQIRIANIRDNQDKIESLKEKLVQEKSKLHCGCHKRYPITVLCGEEIEFDRMSIDFFNEKYYTREEMVQKMHAKGEYLVEYDPSNPPLKPQTEKQTEWFKVVKLPKPTKKDGTEVNKNLLKAFKEALIDARDNRRIITFVPKFFTSEYHKYRTLEIILDNLGDIILETFIPHTEASLGKPKEEWTIAEKNHHRSVILMREAGEISASSLKSENSSVLVKKKVLKLCRVARHFNISMLLDAQRAEDIFNGVRSQANTILLKRTPNKLLGDELKWVREYIDDKRNAFFESYGYTPDTIEVMDRKYPKLSELPTNQCYAVYSDDWVELFDIPAPNTHHKQEDDRFETLTGITYKVVDIVTTTTDGTKTVSVKNTQEDEVFYNYIYGLRNPEKGKAMQFKDILTKAVKEKQSGKLGIGKDIESMQHDSLRKWFKRIKDNKEKETKQSIVQ